MPTPTEWHALLRGREGDQGLRQHPGTRSSCAECAVQASVCIAPTACGATARTYFSVHHANRLWRHCPFALPTGAVQAASVVFVALAGQPVRGSLCAG